MTLHWFLRLQVVMWQGDGCCLLRIPGVLWKQKSAESTQRCPQICSKMELKRRKFIQSRAATLEQSTYFKQVTSPTGVKCSAGLELQKVSQLNLSCGGTWAERGGAFNQRLLAEGKWGEECRGNKLESGWCSTVRARNLPLVWKQSERRVMPPKCLPRWQGGGKQHFQQTGLTNRKGEWEGQQQKEKIFNFTRTTLSHLLGFWQKDKSWHLQSVLTPL